MAALESIAIKLAIQVSTSKDGKKIIAGIIILLITIIFLPIILIFFIVISISMWLNPNLSTDISSDLYFMAINELKTELNISNNLNFAIPKIIFTLYSENYESNMDFDDTKSFIRQYFILESLVEIESSNEDFEILSYTKAYEFISENQVNDIIKLEPFLFDDDQIEGFHIMKLLSQTGSLFPPTESNKKFTGIYPMPCEPGSVNSWFGFRGGAYPGYHNGIDISPPHHSPIYSIADGIVTKINTSTSSLGNYIVIKHNGFYTVYGHLSSVNVFTGQSISSGKIIGREGGDKSDPNPGQSTGHHLHFEVRLTPENTSAVDPLPYLKGWQ